MSSILYISYDGILEPLGQSQVLRYLEKLALSHKIFLISFEKKNDWKNDIDNRDALNIKIREAGIHWIPLRYHKNPSAFATAFDIVQGILVGLWVCFRYQIQVVHARSYIPSVMTLILKFFFRVKYLFDMRGFWADERVDGGLWLADSKMYMVAKWFERHFFLSADCIVSLTKVAVEEIKMNSYLQNRQLNFEVITTCTDLQRFKPVDEVQTNKNDKPLVIGYVGAVGVWYLFDETLICFKFLLKEIPSAKLHILNRGEHKYIKDCLKKHKLPLSSVLIESVQHQEVPKKIQKMDAAIFFIKPAFSKLASAPTKFGEFLACGVPCLSNTGIGDMAEIIKKESVGIAINDFSNESMQEGVRRLIKLTQDSNIRKRCRSSAIKNFSLEEGVKSYSQIYTNLLR
ncbi:glycosyltransferase [Candidatus Thioglobus sp.]|nr:glycosyltransferase [Candidatus Thioglobus sp.]